MKVHAHQAIFENWRIIGWCSPLHFPSFKIHLSNSSIQDTYTTTTKEMCRKYA